MAVNSRWSTHIKKPATFAINREHFVWKGMDKDIELLVTYYIQCVINESGEREPRPVDWTLLQGSKHKSIYIHFFHTSKEGHWQKYVVVIKDDLKPYVWLHSWKPADIETVASELIDWLAASGKPEPGCWSVQPFRKWSHDPFVKTTLFCSSIYLAVLLPV